MDQAMDCLLRLLRWPALVPVLTLVSYVICAFDAASDTICKYYTVFCPLLMFDGNMKMKGVRIVHWCQSVW